MNLKAIADQTIPAPDGRDIIKNTAGNTFDIVKAVIGAFMDSRGKLNQFAPYLKGGTLKQTLFNVWSFWKKNIRYQVDQKGTQGVKQPQALWSLKVGDCKSLSIAVMSTLDSLGIKAAFRFAGYNGNTEFPTHVYVVVKDRGELIPVDCVWKKFGEEKTPLSKNWDYNMPTEIHVISGVEDKPVLPSQQRREAILAHRRELARKRGNDREAIVKKRNHLKKCTCQEPKHGELKIPAGDHITEGVAQALLHKQRLELEQKLHAINGGIGSTEDNAYTIQITGLHNALAEVMGWRKKRIVAHSSPKLLHDRNHAICGITNDGNYIVTNGHSESIAFDVARANETADEIGNIFSSIWKGIKSVGKAIGKGAKAVAKVVTAPVRFLAKKVGGVAIKALTAPARQAINESLPQLAPFFLYTFITDPKLLSKLPQAVAIKRDKALYYRKIITVKLGMDAVTFDQTVRNGIMQAFQMKPEEVVAKWIKDTNFQIGNPVAIITTAISALKGVGKFLLGDTGDNIAQDAEAFAPAVEDWGALTPEARAAAAAQAQVNVPQPMTTQQLYNQYTPGYANSAPLTQYDSYNTDTQGSESYPTFPQPDFSGGGTTGNDWGKTSAPGENRSPYPNTGTKLAQPKDMDEVIIRNGKAVFDEPPADNNNSLLILGGLGLALVLASSKKGKK